MALHIILINFSQKRQHCTETKVFRKVYVSTQYVNDQTDSFILPYMPHDEDNIYRIQAGVRFSWAY